MPNIDVAKALIKELGDDIPGGKGESELMTFVGDRAFNDLRYTISSDKLLALGWVEEVSWEDGLRQTVEWYKQYTSRYGDIEGALVAHPRQGMKVEGPA